MTSRTFAAIAGLVVGLHVGCGNSSPTAPSTVPRPTPPAPTAPLTPGRIVIAGAWTLGSIQPPGQAEQATPAGVGYMLTLTDGRLSTRVDCNTCSGAFALSGQTLTAGPLLACTVTACPTMAFGTMYTGILSGDSTVTLSGATLVLSSA